MSRQKATGAPHLDAVRILIMLFCEHANETTHAADKPRRQSKNNITHEPECFFY
jgi:hypothetical protein